jgi:hypothetical protein
MTAPVDNKTITESLIIEKPKRVQKRTKKTIQTKTIKLGVG